jgi:hypothetical protein
MHAILAPCVAQFGGWDFRATAGLFAEQPAPLSKIVTRRRPSTSAEALFRTDARLLIASVRQQPNTSVQYQYSRLIFV